jgi:sugar/nucleoside kinase (ribokinase family)
LPEIVCIGIAVADILAVPVARYPEPGEVEVVDRMILHSGGCAVNTAIAASKLGAKSGVVARVGDDTFGAFVRQQLHDSRVDTQGLTIDPETPSSSTMVLVAPDGQRSFIHNRGANSTLTLETIDFGILERPRHVHIGGALLMPGLDGEPTATLLRMAEERSKITSIDTAWGESDDWMELLAPSLPHCDYLFCSAEEGARLTGKDDPYDVADAILDRQAGAVVVKLGSRGCIVKTSSRSKFPDQCFAWPALSVDVMDTCGAGDCFVAGFLVGLLSGRDVTDCATLANAAGALSVTKLGSTAAIGSLEELETLIQQRM